MPRARVCVCVCVCVCVRARVGGWVGVGVLMRLKSRNLYKAHVKHLINVLAKFKLPSSIWWEDREGKIFFKSQKERKPLIISPLNWHRRLIFGYVIQIWFIHRLAEKEANFEILAPQHPLSHIWTQVNFDPRSSPL